MIQSLEHLITRTEEVFLGLAEQYPRLLAEMRKSLEQSRNQVSGVKQEEHGESTVRRIMSETESVITGATSSFAEMHEQDEDLFLRLDEGIRRLSSIEGLIDRIRDDSIEMELVSLNAMTVALKAGQSGRAFSYITDELKRLSARTIDLTERISNRGETLEDAFRRYRESLSKTRDFHDTLFSQFASRLTESFQEFDRGVQEVVDTLSSIQSRSEEIRQPLTKIMEAIQLQDIIKQSVDHVIISVGQLKELSETDSHVELLDELSFLKILPALCKSLLDDVSVKISESLGLIRDQSAHAERIVGTVERERKDFLNSALSTDQSGGHSLSSLFEDSSAMLQKLLEDIGESVKLKETVTKISGVLTDQVSTLEDDFTLFSSLTTRFHSIDIASRIEIAKQPVLQKMLGSESPMTELTKRIDADVQASLDATKEFTAATGTTIAQYEDTFRDEEQIVEQFRADIRSRYDALFAAKNELTEEIRGFELFTTRFLALFEDTREKLEQLEALVGDIDRIQTSLDSVHQDAVRRMDQVLSEHDLDDWTIESEKLKSIIERFTIFTHKQTAGDIIGFDVEGGAESGDVTLF
jgi:methyl-accepting chemotaxis protein